MRPCGLLPTTLLGLRRRKLAIYPVDLAPLSYCYKL